MVRVAPHDTRPPARAPCGSAWRALALGPALLVLGAGWRWSRPEAALPRDWYPPAIAGVGLLLGWAPWGAARAALARRDRHARAPLRPRLWSFASLEWRPRPGAAGRRRQAGALRRRGVDPRPAAVDGPLRARLRHGLGARHRGPGRARARAVRRIGGARDLPATTATPTASATRRHRGARGRGAVAGARGLGAARRALDDPAPALPRPPSSPSTPSCPRAARRRRRRWPMVPIVLAFAPDRLRLLARLTVVGGGSRCRSSRCSPSTRRPPWTAPS